MIKKFFLILLCLILINCGGSGGRNTSNEPIMDDMLSVNAKTLVIPEGDADCPFGGVLVNMGVDENRNGFLDDIEIDSSEKVCNGSDGFDTLVSIADEPAGANCSNGGKKIESGSDINRSGILDISETSSINYICNGADGADGNNAYSDNYSIIKRRDGGEVISFTCLGRDNHLIYNDYYTYESGGNGTPYKTCMSEYCETYIENGLLSYSKLSGTNCLNQISEGIYCNYNYTLIDGVCEPEPIVCSVSYPSQCTTQAECEANKGHWWLNSCHVTCPVGEIETSRGCEMPVTTCTPYQTVVDNQCVDLQFTSVTGSICGTYNDPVNITAGDHIITCNSTFNDKVVVEAGANLEVDNNWTVEFKNLYAKGTEVNHITLSASAGNSLGYWNSLNIKEGKVLYDHLGYISGNYMSYVDISDVNQPSYLNNIFAENITITSNGNIDIENSYILNSTFDVSYSSLGVTSRYLNKSSFSSFFLKNTVTAYYANMLYNVMAAWSYFSGKVNVFSGSALLFNDIAGDISCGSGSNIFGNKHTSSIYMGCEQSDNSIIAVSDKVALYIINADRTNLNINENKVFSVYALDKVDWINNATINWIAQYDFDGVFFDYPTTWTGYNPLISLNTKESYHLSVELDDPTINTMGRKTVVVDAL